MNRNPRRGHTPLIAGCDQCEQLRNFLRGVVLATGFARAGGIYLHKVLIGVIEQINRVVVVVSIEWQSANLVQQLDKLRISLCHGITELGAIDVEVIEETFKVIFTVRANR